MFLVYEQRGGLHAVAGKCGRGTGGGVGHDQGKICAAAGLKARFGGSKAEPSGDHELRNIRHAFRGIRRKSSLPEGLDLKL
jgi:hypothetical protein